ncbi:MAG: AAA family ATPase [Dehalococcoidia bacterium]|nr:AAA family ATPase [Dehalococcoidia bacterium]
MNLTSAQEQAVTERGRDVIVTAGAGSGKTRVLVERYVSLLEDHDIDQLVAVTFTDAAAAEMRGRVRQAVTSRQNLKRHIPHLDHAIIGTIHSLCLQLLRDNPVAAGIDPGATVLDENEAQVELLIACRDAIEAAATGEGPGVEALLWIGVHATREALPRMVERRDEVEGAFGSDSRPEREAHIKSVLDAHVDGLVRELRPILADHRGFLIHARIPDRIDRLTGTVEAVLEELGDPMAGDNDDLISRLRAVSEIPSPGSVGSRNTWFATPIEVRAVVRELRAAYETVGPFQWNDADVDALDALESLKELFLAACDRYEARKHDLSALDFLDLELKAIALLQESPRTVAAYRSRFRHILVDEAQDLNPPQFRFLELLTGERGDSPESRPERFFVGDIKQSIYRFRRSDVRNLNNLLKQVKHDDGALVSLNTSFRSHERLVKGVNVVMRDVFGEAKADYEAPMEPMIAIRASGNSHPAMEALPIAREFANPDEAGTPRDSEKRRMEADRCAQRIRRLIDDGFPVWDNDKNEYRPATAGDVVILMRGMIHAYEYERALENHGIRYRTASGGDFYTRSEIVDLTNLMEWLAEPANGIALVGLLRSPFFAIDDETLLALTQTQSSRPDGNSILHALSNLPEDILRQTRPLRVRAARILEQLREESRLATPEQLLEQALNLTNYEAAWAPVRGGDQVLANIRQFAGIARSLPDKTVDEFVDHIRTLRDDLETRAPQAALDAVDAVRLLTIHSSKGLEFPIVFLADAGANRGGPRTSTVLWRAEEGISLTLERDVSEIDENRRQPGFYAYLKELERREDEAENKRLLYVAATRAADLFVVSGAEPTENNEPWLSIFTKPEYGDHINISEPTRVDLDALKSRSPKVSLKIPESETEQPADAPLLGRRGAIPIRSSTPATALEQGDGTRFSGRSDPLALIRGTLTHAAIEEWFTKEKRPDIRDLAHRTGLRLNDEDMADIEADVNAMLGDFDSSNLAATLRGDATTQKHFEMPFSWEWGGVAVHGAIDLAYLTNGEWHVVDFKTDRVEKGREAEHAETYLTQLGVYAGAIEAATGHRPKAGLMFLRTGTLHWAEPDEIDAALSGTRQKIDSGEIALTETDETGEFADEQLSI